MRAPMGRPGAAKVALSDAHGDSIEIGRARVRLKLGAIAYVNAQLGIDTNVEVARAALEVLCEAGVRYWENLTGKLFRGELDTTKAAQLRVAALAYVNARHGVDANIEIARAGLGILCEASIKYVEAMLEEA